MNEDVKKDVKKVEWAPPQPEFTLNSVAVTADSVEFDLEISEEV